MLMYSSTLTIAIVYILLVNIINFFRENNLQYPIFYILYSLYYFKSLVLIVSTKVFES